MSAHVTTDDDAQDSQDKTPLVGGGNAPRDDPVVSLRLRETTLVEITNSLAADARRHADAERPHTAKHLRRLRQELLAAADR